MNCFLLIVLAASSLMMEFESQDVCVMSPNSNINLKKDICSVSDVMVMVDSNIYIGLNSNFVIPEYNYRKIRRHYKNHPNYSSWTNQIQNLSTNQSFKSEMYKCKAFFDDIDRNYFSAISNYYNAYLYNTNNTDCLVMSIAQSTRVGTNSFLDNVLNEVKKSRIDDFYKITLPIYYEMTAKNYSDSRTKTEVALNKYPKNKLLENFYGNSVLKNPNDGKEFQTLTNMYNNSLISDDCFRSYVFTAFIGEKYDRLIKAYEIILNQDIKRTYLITLYLYALQKQDQKSKIKDLQKYIDTLERKDMNTFEDYILLLYNTKKKDLLINSLREYYKGWPSMTTNLCKSFRIRTSLIANPPIKE